MLNLEPVCVWHKCTATVARTCEGKKLVVVVIGKLVFTSFERTARHCNASTVHKQFCVRRNETKTGTIARAPQNWASVNFRAD